MCWRIPNISGVKPKKSGATGRPLGAPLLREGNVVGVLFVAKTVPQPFTDKQIELVKTFADQAVIAIENTRLLNELRESLQQQTATADVLKVISSSPGELEPVFHAMLENATRICEASFGSMLLREGNRFRRVAVHNAPIGFAKFTEKMPIVDPTISLAVTRIWTTKQIVHTADLLVEGS